MRMPSMAPMWAAVRVLILVMIVREYLIVMRFKRKGVEVPGRIVEKDKTKGTFWNKYTGVEYLVFEYYPVQANWHFRQRQFVSWQLCDRVKVGDDVSIRYMPDRPHRARLWGLDGDEVSPSRLLISLFFATELWVLDFLLFWIYSPAFRAR